MPVEYERKYILTDIAALIAKLKSVPSVLIHQAYLTPQARVRRVETPGDDGKEYVFTFKFPVEGRLLEIETDIVPSDYELAVLGSDRALNKVRFKILKPDEGPTQASWDIDFLVRDAVPFDADGKPRFGSDHVYFALAEVETEEGADHEMLDFLAPHVLYAVPHADNKLFSNERLCDRSYAEETLRGLKKTAAQGRG